MVIIKVDHITKDYGQNRGVFDVSFTVKKGEVLGFLGPNGSGKTTTIRQLLGFIKPQSGSVSILGKDCFTKANEIQKNLGYLPGEIAFIDSMSGMEFIKFVAKMKKMDGLGRAPELMKRFDLNANGKLKRMSKGMKQKIGIVCAFMQDPDILILDEPTSGLDPLMQNCFVDLIQSEKKRGKTILMSSHIFEEIEKTCDRAAIIREGRLVAVDTIENLCAGKKKHMKVVFQAEDMATDFAKNHKGVKQNGSEISMKVGSNIDQVIKDLGTYSVLDMDLQDQSLEEFFLHFYGGENHDSDDAL